MSDAIVPGWYKEKWDQQVILRYQNRGYVLKGTTMEPVRIEGKKFHFLRTKTMEAQPWAKGDSVSGLNPEDDTITIESAEWDAAFHLYDWDVTRLSPREVDSRQQQAVAALGRRSDRITYDAVMAATLPNDQIFGDYANPFDPYVFLSGLERLAALDVETADGGVFAPIPSRAFYQLQTYKIFSNTQWIGPDLPLKKMVKHATFDVANAFIQPPHLTQAYTDGTELRFRIWHKSAMGAGHNDNLRTEWTRQGEKKRWLVNHTFDGVATALQTEGIIEFRMKADSAIEREVDLVMSEEA